MAKLISLIFITCLQSVFLQVLSSGPAPFVTTEGCEKSKTCVTMPDGCDETSCYFISWKESPLPDSIEIELLGPVKQGSESYIAMAFGTMNKMQDGDVYFCGKNEMKTAAMQNYQTAPEELPLEDGMYPGPMGVVNGRVQCTFTRPMSLTKTISDLKQHKFDLAADTYYLLMAGGVLNDGYLEYHTWSGIYKNKINFTENFESERKYWTTPSPTTSEETKTPAKEPQVSPETTTKTAGYVGNMSTPEPETEMTTTGGASVIGSFIWLLMSCILLTLVL